MPINQTYDEKELLRRAAGGDISAYETLYTLYLPKLYHYIYRFTSASEEDTKDICQEIFIRLWDKKELLYSVESFDSYLKRSGRNALLDFLKHSQFKERLHHIYSTSREKHAEDVEDNLQLMEYNRLAKEAISRLPEKQRRIFLLRTQEDMSLDDISALLKLSKSRVKQHIYEAKSSIKGFLKAHAGWMLVWFFRDF